MTKPKGAPKGPGPSKNIFTIAENDTPDRATVMAARGYVLDPVTGKWR